MLQNMYALGEKHVFNRDITTFDLLLIYIYSVTNDVCIYLLLFFYFF